MKPLVVGMHFECPRCGNLIFKQFPEGRYDPVTSCPNKKCRTRGLTPKKETACAVDWQRARIQEIVGEDDFDVGRVPRT